MDNDIKEACKIMQEGGLILYPTDTIWGIGCDATNELAVKRVYEIKKRIDSKALIVLVDSPAKIDFYTIVYPNARNLAHNLLAEDGSVGIRITKEPFSHKLCERFRKAIVSTSANISGAPSPRNFSEISQEIKDAVDYIVEYRQNEMTHPSPSSVIKLEEGGIVKILRP